jgi:hypothetical protein
MEKPKMKQNQRRRHDGPPYSPKAEAMQLLQLPDKPAAVPLHEWQQYRQLACECEGAERLVRDLRQRLDKLKVQLARRIDDHHGHEHEELENLLALVPVTDLLQ